jgi:radical SAM superfamily enzyme YgiQ (UPF0313 family)
MICLVRPPATECFRFATTSLSLPLGLAYVAGALEAAGRRVHVVDAVGEAPDQRTRYVTGYLIGLSLEEIADRIPSDATLVGITVIFTHEWPAVVRLIDLIKARRPDLPVVLGGEHITSLPEFCMATSQADYLILGEGEETAVHLVETLEHGTPLQQVDGLVFRDTDAVVVVNRRRARVRTVDDIAWPAWHHFKLDVYHAHRFVGGIYSPALTIPILATRGCPYQCTYCSSPNMWSPLWVPRDPTKVVDEIEHYVRTYGAGNFPFQDLTAIIQKDWIVGFCTELIRRGLRIGWQLPSGTRSEAIDDEVAGLLARSNMTNMAYAPESGSDTTRRLIKKKMRADRLFRSISAAVEAGLNVSVFMVIGLPHDTPEHLAENLPFVDRLVESGVRDMSVSFYMALPGTELFESLYDAGRIQLDRAYFSHMIHNLSLVPVHSYCARSSRLDLVRWKLRLFLRFYGSRRAVGRRPGLGTSVRRALSGLRQGGHDSKLQTAFRNAMTSGLDTARTRFKKRWMPLDEERRMFASWDAIFRDIRRAKRDAGISLPAPEDTTRLHTGNVQAALRREHDVPRRIPLGSAVRRTLPA